MPFCPRCRGEYLEGFTICAGCGIALVETLPPPRPAPLPPPPIHEESIGVFAGPAEAEMWAELLKNHNIPAVVVTLGVGTYNGTGSPCEPRVRADDATRARELLNNQR